MFFRKPQEVFYLNSQMSLISYHVPSMFALLYFFFPMPPAPSLGRKGPLLTPSGPCLTCCHPPTHTQGIRRLVPGGLSPLSLMEGAEGIQISDHLCHSSHVPCVTDMCCPDVLQTKRKKESCFSFYS